MTAATVLVQSLYAAAALAGLVLVAVDVHHRRSRKRGGGR